MPLSALLIVKQILAVLLLWLLHRIWLLPAYPSV